MCPRNFLVPKQLQTLAQATLRAARVFAEKDFLLNVQHKPQQPREDWWWDHFLPGQRVQQWHAAGCATAAAAKPE